MRLPAQGPGSRQEGWSPSTESGLQACYGKSPGNGAFSMLVVRREIVRVAGQGLRRFLWNRSVWAPGRSPSGCAGNAPLRTENASRAPGGVPRRSALAGTYANLVAGFLHDVHRSHRVTRSMSRGLFSNPVAVIRASRRFGEWCAGVS